jgi:pimeloyl-ACP methyl ester carboxylesterase
MDAERASWRSDALGPARRIELDAGAIRAHVIGDGPSVVFVHGLLVNANLWRNVVSRLDGCRRVALDLPLGSHLESMPREADLSPPGLADIVADAIEALELDDVTVVGNDTGGALAQILAARRPERLARLVLTSCDAFDNFPPRFFRIVLAPARVPGVIPVAFAGVRVRALRRLPIAYGWLSSEAIDPRAEDSYVLPGLTRGEIRRDVRRVLAGLDARHTLEAAIRLPAFRKPVMIAWSSDDRFFPAEHAERLAKLFRDSRLEWIEGARTFSPEDRPDRLAELIASFVGAPAPA